MVVVSIHIIDIMYFNLIYVLCFCISQSNEIDHFLLQSLWSRSDGGVTVKYSLCTLTVRIIYSVPIFNIRKHSTEVYLFEYIATHMGIMISYFRQCIIFPTNQMEMKVKLAIIFLFIDQYPRKTFRKKILSGKENQKRMTM